MAGGKKGPNSEVSKTFFCPLPPYSPPPPPPHAVGVYINCQAFTQLSNVMTPRAPSTLAPLLHTVTFTQCRRSTFMS